MRRRKRDTTKEEEWLDWVPPGESRDFKEEEMREEGSLTEGTGTGNGAKAAETAGFVSGSVFLVQAYSNVLKNDFLDLQLFD